MSFVLIVGVVLLNVVIACLLDHFIRFMTDEADREKKAILEEARALTACPGLCRCVC
jgi:hypothetical protein